jgi:hypothetical protein
VAPSNAQALKDSGRVRFVEPTVGGVKPKKVLVNKWTLWAWALYVDTVRMTRGRRPGSKRKHDIGMIWKQLAGMKPGWREIKVLYSTAVLYPHRLLQSRVA